MSIPERILITGATGEIGSALALEYARTGASLILQGRRTERLLEVARDCVALGAAVETCALDVTDRPALLDWLAGICGDRLPDIVIVNAGMNTNIGPDGAGEKWADAEALIQTNLISAMVIVDAVLPAFRRRGSGQIGLVSSLAAYFGLPVTPAYCASKAGLKAYGEALRGWLSPEGIRVNVIMPGYVRSPMCDGMPGPKPFLLTPGRAAQLIRRGLQRDVPRISFPFPLNWGTWWLAVLPAGISGRIVRWMGYGG